MGGLADVERDVCAAGDLEVSVRMVNGTEPEAVTYLAGSAGSTFSWTRSSTSGFTLVTPQAIRALCPAMTPGVPGKVTPMTSYGQAAETCRQWRPLMYQMDGMLNPRCGSLARMGLPLAV